MSLIFFSDFYSFTALIFFKLILICSGRMTQLKKVTYLTPNLHFNSFNLKSALSKASMIAATYPQCSLTFLEYINMSFKQYIAYSLMKSRRISLFCLQHVAGAFMSLNGIIIYSHKPEGSTKVVFYSCPFLIRIKLNALR